MLAFRDPATGHVQITQSADGYGPPWEPLPPPPADQGWRWHDGGNQWVPAPPPMAPEKLWQLLTIEQHLAVRVLAQSQPLLAVAIDRLNARRDPLPLDDVSFVSFVMAAVSGGAVSLSEGQRIMRGQLPVGV